MIKLQSLPSRIIRYDETLTVYREGSVVYKDGKPDKWLVEPFTIACNVQPLSGRDLLMVPEGDRFKEQYWVWMQTPLPEKAVKINDRVLREDVNFQVQSAENWGSYVRARIMRIDVGPNRTP